MGDFRVRVGEVVEVRSDRGGAVRVLDADGLREFRAGHDNLDAFNDGGGGVPDAVFVGEVEMLELLVRGFASGLDKSNNRQSSISSGG